MGDKSVETLGSKIRFPSVLETFPPPPSGLNNVFFIDSTDHGAYTALNWWAGGIREITRDTNNKMEQVPQYRKASFSKSVSTAFVAHCSSVPGTPQNNKDKKYETTLSFTRI